MTTKSIINNQVCVNIPQGLGYPTPGCTWGAYAGEYTLEECGSGKGVVGNTQGFAEEDVLKSVVRAPFNNGLVSSLSSKLSPHVAHALVEAVRGRKWGALKALFGWRGSL